MTTLTEQLTTAKANIDTATQAVAAAQANLDQANAAAAAIQAAIDSVQPHLSLLDQIETELAKVEDGVTAEMAQALAAIKASVDPLISQMRATFNV